MFLSNFISSFFFIPSFSFTDPLSCVLIFFILIAYFFKPSKHYLARHVYEARKLAHFSSTREKYESPIVRHPSISFKNPLVRLPFLFSSPLYAAHQSNDITSFELWQALSQHFITTNNISPGWIQDDQKNKLTYSQFGTMIASIVTALCQLDLPKKASPIYFVLQQYSIFALVMELACIYLGIPMAYLKNTATVTSLCHSRPPCLILTDPELVHSIESSVPTSIPVVALTLSEAWESMLSLKQWITYPPSSLIEKHQEEIESPLWMDSIPYEQCVLSLAGLVHQFSPLHRPSYRSHLMVHFPLTEENQAKRLFLYTFLSFGSSITISSISPPTSLILNQFQPTHIYSNISVTPSLSWIYRWVLRSYLNQSKQIQISLPWSEYPWYQKWVLSFARRSNLGGSNLKYWYSSELIHVPWYLGISHQRVWGPYAYLSTITLSLPYRLDLSSGIPLSHCELKLKKTQLYIRTSGHDRWMDTGIEGYMFADGSVLSKEDFQLVQLQKQETWLVS